VRVTQKEKKIIPLEKLHILLNVFFWGGQGYFLWHLRLFAADTNQDTNLLVILFLR